MDKRNHLCARQLRNKLTVEKNAAQTNADGQKVESWRPEFKVWAKITARGAMERRVFEQLRAECDYLIQILWSRKAVQIKPADYRLVGDGKTFNIGGVYDPDGTKQQLHLHCTEVVI